MGVQLSPRGAGQHSSAQHMLTSPWDCTLWLLKGWSGSAAWNSCPANNVGWIVLAPLIRFGITPQHEYTEVFSREDARRLIVFVYRLCHDIEAALQASEPLPACAFYDNIC